MDQNILAPPGTRHVDPQNAPKSAKTMQCNPELNKNIQIQTHTSRILVLVEPLSDSFHDVYRFSTVLMFILVKIKVGLVGLV